MSYPLWARYSKMLISRVQHRVRGGWPIPHATTTPSHNVVMYFRRAHSAAVLDQLAVIVYPISHRAKALGTLALGSLLAPRQHSTPSITMLLERRGAGVELRTAPLAFPASASLFMRRLEALCERDSNIVQDDSVDLSPLSFKPQQIPSF